MEQLRQIVNSNFPFLDFTLDVYKDSPIPVLDTQFWVGPASNNGPWYAPPGDSRSPPPPGDMERETAQVPIYMFYKKPMAPAIGILARSAPPESCKVATAAGEVRRRLKNSSRLISKELVETIIVSYMDELNAAGYGQSWREKVLGAALLGYERVLEKERKGLTTRNRSGAMTHMSRRAKKLCGSSAWFKDKPEEEETPTSGEGGRGKKRKKGGA